MMRPFFNSLPNEIQTNGTAVPAPQLQGNSGNPRPSNNFQGNPMPNSAQIQPQMGMINNNSQIPNPFNNYNIHSNNGNIAMPNRPTSQFFMNNPRGPFINAPLNIQFPLQNGMPLPGQQQGQLFNGFNGPQSMGPIVMDQMNNNCQPNPQLFAANSMNISPYFNQHVGFPNGMQNPMYQFVQMQIPNYNSQVVQGHIPIMFQNQGSQPMAPHHLMQMPNYNSNGIMQQGNQEHQQQNRLIPPNSMVNGPNNAAQQLQGNNSSLSVQPNQTQNFAHGFAKSQGNHGKENGVNISNTNWKNSPNKNLGRNKNVEASHKGLMTSQFHQKQDSNSKFNFHNERGEKAYNNKARKSGFAASINQTQVEKKRSLPLNYTEEEIRQWREERKKNYPSKDNVDKKLTKREIADSDAKLRRQQLKEILTKQAELGCEVAEIPPDYLSDSDKLINGNENNKLAFNNKGRQQNNFNNKRGKGRFSKNNRFNKNQGPAVAYGNDQIIEDSLSNKKQRLDNSNFSVNSKRENTTLLQKLLCSDVKRDKTRLLQVFRFVVMNSYLKEYDSENKQRTLRFPNVVVRQAEEGRCLVKDYVFPKISGDKLIREEVNGGDEETETRIFKEKGSGGFSSSTGIVEEEEGEIID